MARDRDKDLDTDTTAVSVAPVTDRRRTGRAFLTVLSGKRLGSVLVVDRESVLGRGSDVRVVLPDEGVSRAHAKVVIDRHARARLQDLGSTNGTFLNGDRIRDEALRDNDRIQLGRGTTLMFRYEYKDQASSAGLASPMSQSEALADGGRATMMDHDTEDRPIPASPRAGTESMEMLVEGVASTLENLGRMYEAKGDHERAIEVFRRSHRIHEQKLGPNHPMVGVLMARIAGLLRLTRRSDEARDYFEQALELLERSDLAAGPDEKEAVAVEAIHRARFGLARVLAEIGVDEPRARDLGRMARDGLARAGSEEEATEVASWLRERGWS